MINMIISMKPRLFNFLVSFATYEGTFWLLDYYFYQIPVFSDDSDCLEWPLILVHAEFMQVDVIKQVNESIGIGHYVQQVRCLTII